jgi:hypothetical protein
MSCDDCVRDPVWQACRRHAREYRLDEHLTSATVVFYLPIVLALLVVGGLVWLGWGQLL